ncbi:hypothetical protein D030_1481, partial [Vibrio parahaemolyticus AQ3810]
MEASALSLQGGKTT